MKIRVLRWEEFQQYKDRRPNWIKLYRALLENRNWHALSGGAAKLLVEVWLVASESSDGTVPEVPVEDFAWRLRRDPNDLPAMLAELTAARFIECDGCGCTELYAGVQERTQRRGEEIQQLEDIKKLPGAANVEKSEEEQRRAWGELMVAVRGVAGLNKLTADQIRRSASVAKDMMAKGETAERITWAIEGVRRLAERGRCWIKPGEPFALMALQGTGTIVHHHSGEILERRLFDVGLEADIRPTTQPRTAKVGNIQSVGDIVRKILPDGPGAGA